MAINPEAQRVPNIRERIAKVNSLLSEALDVAQRICGDEPVSEERETIVNASDVLLTEVENTIRETLTSSIHILAQLRRIEERL